MVRDISSQTACDKYLELIQSLQVGEIYRYTGNGEFEIVNLKEEILKALLNNTFGGEK